MNSEKQFDINYLIEKGKAEGSISNDDLLDAIDNYQDLDSQPCA